jgi:hypothetical protein
MCGSDGIKKLAAVPVKLSPISLTLQHAAKIQKTLRYLGNGYALRFRRPLLGVLPLSVRLNCHRSRRIGNAITVPNRRQGVNFADSARKHAIFDRRDPAKAVYRSPGEKHHAHRQE